MRHFLEFERPIAELEGKIEELRHLSADTGLNIAEEVGRLEAQAGRLLRQSYARLTPWQKVLVARHPDRPHSLAYIAALITDFVPLAGDRAFAEDAAIIGGIGRFRGRSVLVLGTEKGADTEARVKHNFGMARPEGYRKARRLMRLAERFTLPVLTFIDTAGAYPGVDAEARGQSEAIARAIETCLDIRVPVVASVIGEGGSGGAIALAAANASRSAAEPQPSRGGFGLRPASLTGDGRSPHLAWRVHGTAPVASSEANHSSLEGVHDPPGKRSDHHPARPSQERRRTAKGSGRRPADPPGHGGAAGRALLPGADGPDPGSEPAS